MRNTFFATALLFLLLLLAVPDLFDFISAWHGLLASHVNSIIRYTLMALLGGGALFFVIRRMLDLRLAKHALRQKVFPVISSTYLAISAAMDGHDARTEAHNITTLVEECRGIRTLNKLLASYHHHWDTLAGYYLGNGTDKTRIRMARDELDEARERIYAWLGVRREASRR